MTETENVSLFQVVITAEATVTHADGTTDADDSTTPQED